MEKKCYKAISRSSSVIYRQMNIYMKHRLEDYDVEPSEMLALLYMKNNDGVNQESLRDTLAYDKGVMSRIIKKLMEKDYLVRKPSLTDKRAFELYRTEKALAFEPTIFELLKDWNMVLVGSEDEEKILRLQKELWDMANRAIEKVEEMLDGE